MALTPTTGYIKHTEFSAVYDYQSVAESAVLAFSLIPRPQPDGIRTDDDYGYLQDVSIKYNDDGAVSRTRYNTLEMEQARAEFVLDSASAQTSWSTAIETDDKTNGSETQYKNDGIELRVDRGMFRQYYTGTVVPKDCAIDALYLDRQNDTSQTDYIETTGIKHDTASSYEWTPYDENESCSSYIMKEVATHNTIIVNHRTTEGRTYPIFRAVAS